MKTFKELKQVTIEELVNNVVTNIKKEEVNGSKTVDSLIIEDLDGTKLNGYDVIDHLYEKDVIVICVKGKEGDEVVYLKRNTITIKLTHGDEIAIVIYDSRYKELNGNELIEMYNMIEF